MADVETSAPVAAPAGEHTYNFNITMSCGGCSGAVERVLKKLDGVFSSPPLTHMCLFFPTFVFALLLG